MLSNISTAGATSVLSSTSPAPTPIPSCSNHWFAESCAWTGRWQPLLLSLPLLRIGGFLNTSEHSFVVEVLVFVQQLEVGQAARTLHLLGAKEEEGTLAKKMFPRCSWRSWWHALQVLAYKIIL
mmetsp:Transcript_17845/g.49884  ORF Transcript_17845/g.49884 Transcript_17845/m.49884 type:complete len:124 (-) Transcript_17845:37-408(-)